MGAMTPRPDDDGRGLGSTLAEINVTPLVDVMLVLLVIFMVASSVETMRAERELQAAREQLEQVAEPQVNPAQRVPVDLPRTNSEPVNLAEERKLVLSVDDKLVFYLGDRAIVKCKRAARKATKPGDEAFRQCLDALERKLGANERLRRDGELYLRADRKLPYGRVLAVMARVRKAGVTRFGLIAEPEEP